MRTLAKQFGARIEPRPLLVEAMLATDANAKDTEAPWVVLLDGEQFDISYPQLEHETSQCPLSPRLRTTIAHELLHTLMFRDGKEGPEPNAPREKGRSAKYYVKRMEQLTEKLTPLLLIPESEVDDFTVKPSVSFDDFLSLRQRCGVSREILINRFSLLDRQDPRSHRIGLRNKALGIIHRNSSGNWEMKDWPVFYNFDSNRLPWFIAKLAQGVPVEVSKLTNDTSFVLNGGTDLEIELPGHDVRQGLDYMKMRVRLTVDSNRREQDEALLFFVQRLPD